MKNQVTNKYKYDVALSFAGEDRSIVREFADILKSEGLNVFFDEYEEAFLWGKDVYQHLSEVYSKQAYYCVIFISKHYSEKLWTKHELKAAQERAFQQNNPYILPIRIDDTDLPGILSTFGYQDLRQKSVTEIAQFILTKLSQSEVTPGIRSKIENFDKITKEYTETGGSESDLVEMPHQWVIWYDIKDSSGRRNPKNREKSPQVKRYINQKLTRIKGETNDGEFNLEENDEKHILVEKDGNLKRYISELMNATAEYQMFMRIIVICIRDTGELFYRYKETNVIKSSLNHALVKRLGMYLNDGKVDGVAKEDRYHTVAISKEVMYSIWGNEKQFELGEDWYVEFLSSRDGSNEHYGYFPELDKHVSFYVAKCSLNEK